MSFKLNIWFVVALGIGWLQFSAKCIEAKLQVTLPLNRTVYQTNEQIDIAVVRSAAGTLPAGNLGMTLIGDDESKMAFSFPVAAVEPFNGAAAATEHLHLNARLLRPGAYTLGVNCDGATAQNRILVCSHVRKTPYRLVYWSNGPNPSQQQQLGENSLGFNVFWAEGNRCDSANLMLAGMDYMRVCTMSGAHQMDLRGECDWSDPAVLGGGEARVAIQALHDRRNGNALGVHFYDEPGLTWWNAPLFGENTPQNIYPQWLSYENSFGKNPRLFTDETSDEALAKLPPTDRLRVEAFFKQYGRNPFADFYRHMDQNNPADRAEWLRWGRWKEGFMEGAWKYCSFGVSQVAPNLLSTTQSMYGWYAFTDGYYWNITRQLPLVCGHGGYDEWGPGYYHPGFVFAMGRIREYNKPVWYMPSWGGKPSDLFRMEQYSAFMQGAQGLMTPPPIPAFQPNQCPDEAGIVESNLLMARLGPVFTSMPVTRPRVAVLYSLSQNLDYQIKANKVKDINDCAYASPQISRLNVAYVALAMIQQPFFPVVDEDITDGTLAAQHKVVFIPRLDYLDPREKAALEQYIDKGGVVILGDDSTLEIKGARKLGCTVPANGDIAPNLLGQLIKSAEPVAAALKTHLKDADVAPIIGSDNPGIQASVQGQGDIEYIFALNAVHDWEVEKIEDLKKRPGNALARTVAKLSLINDGRPVYDAVRGGTVAELSLDSASKMLSGVFHFGIGELRVFARTAHPIGAVQVGTPVVTCDYTRAQDPLSVSFGATLVDMDGRILSGSAPLQVRVRDPLGSMRYDLFRATNQGMAQISLPLAVNDPPGTWTLQVVDLLAGMVGSATFSYQPPKVCGSLGGTTPRAVIFGQDRENIFRFFRSHHNITIVKGKSEYLNAAAERLATMLKPWRIIVNIVNAEQINKPEPVTGPTWCGPGGFDVPGPCIVMGSPDDNIVLKAFCTNTWTGDQVLPYLPVKDAMPGRGRGILAWQRSVVRQGEESITMIAFDAPGMQEAIGCLYEIAAGLTPLSALTPATETTVVPCAKAVLVPAAQIVWQALVPDHAVTMTVQNQQVSVETADGSVTVFDLNGKQLSQKEGTLPKMTGSPVSAASAAATKQLLNETRVQKFTEIGANYQAVAYWGGTLQIFEGDNLKNQQQLAQDVSALAWLDANTLVVALADGRVQALSIK